MTHLLSAYRDAADEISSVRLKKVWLFLLIFLFAHFISLFADDTPAVVTFTSDFWKFSEGTDEAVVTLVRAGNTSIPAAVTCRSLAMGPARLFVPFTNRVEFPVGVTQAQVTFLLLDNSVLEPREEFSLILSDPSSGTILGAVGGTFAGATVHIADNDSVVQFLGSAIDPIPRFNANEREGVVLLDLFRSVPSGPYNPIIATIKTVEDTARAGTDYLSTETNIILNEYKTQFALPLVNNTNRDGTRTFRVQLLAVSSGTIRNSTALVQIHDDEILGEPGSLDATFAAPFDLSSTIDALAVQHDGKLLVGGLFSTPSQNFLRLLPSGELDKSFQNGGPDSGVQWIFPLADGSLIIAGAFATYQGVARSSIARVLTNGLLDTTYAASLPQSSLLSAALQPDGKLVAVGTFNTANGRPFRSLVRFNTDGSLDESFTTGTNISAWPRVVTIQPDSKILLTGGSFRQGTLRRDEAYRVNSDGSLDQSFDTRGTVFLPDALDLLPDASILFGSITLVHSFPDGTLDSSYNSQVLLKQKVLPDGRTLGLTAEHRAVLLRSDGTPISDFQLDLDLPSLQAVAPGPDGKLYIGGGFTQLNGFRVPSVARIFLDDRTSPARISWSASNFGAAEPFGFARVSLFRSGETNTPGTVTVTLRPLEAEAGVDFAADPHFIEFLPGEALKIFEIPIIDDVIPESDERFELSVSYGGSTELATVQIISDEALVEFSRPERTVSELAGIVPIDLRKLGAIPYAITNIQFSTEGTLSNFSDLFLPLGSSFSIAAGQSNRVYSATVLDDSISEPEEFLTLRLTGTTGNNRIGTNDSFTLRVADNDSPFSAGEGLDAAATAFAATDGGLFLLGGFSSVHGSPFAGFARLSPSGLPVTNYTPHLSANSTPLVLLPDGSILAKERFSPRSPATSEYHVARYLPAGQRDPAYNTNFVFTSILSARPLANLRLLVLNAVNSSPYPSLSAVVLRQDGTVDNAFTNRIYQRLGLSALTADLQSFGALVIGGSIFASTAGPADARDYNSLAHDLIRLNPDNSVDTAFQPVFGGPSGVLLIKTITVLPDDSILVAGPFTNVNGMFQPGLVRLSKSGDLDESFRPDWMAASDSPIDVQQVLLLSSGRILLARKTAKGVEIAAITSSGKIDSAFSNLIFDGRVTSILELGDGRLVVTGEFLHVGADFRARLAFIGPAGDLLPDVPFRLQLMYPQFAIGSLSVSARFAFQGVLEASADLQTWQDISTNSVSFGTSSFSLPQTEPKSLFLRMRQLRIEP